MEDQLNDLTELHQHETSNLKQELASIEEKVAYQAYERARDIQVCMDTIHTCMACMVSIYLDACIQVSRYRYPF